MKNGLRTWMLLLCGIIVIRSNAAIAEISVDVKNWPKSLPEEEYNRPDYYGHGQVTTFSDAIRGKTPMTADDESLIASMLPEKDTERFYLKGGLNKTTVKLDGITNLSTYTNVSSGVPNPKKFTQDVTGGQIGAGYIFEEYRLDVDYLFKTDITYNQLAVFYPQNYPNLESKVSGNHLILNGYYDFKEVYYFKPFVGLSFGLGMNKTSSTFTNTGIATSNGVNVTKSSLSMAYGLQLGSRFRIGKTKFQASASYRYLNLGKAKWLDASGTIYLKGNRTINGFFLDLIYLL